MGHGGIIKAAIKEIQLLSIYLGKNPKIENMRISVLMFKYIFLLLIYIFPSCSRSTQKKLGKKLIRYHEGFISGDVFFNENDTIFDGEVKFYDLKKELVAIAEYTDDKKNGKIQRFSKSRVIQESSYFYDFENGIKIEFDSIGNVFQKYFIYFGRQVGPSTQYKDGKPSRFLFVNFDRKILYKCDFNTDSLIDERGSVTNFTTEFIYENDKKMLAVNFYVIEPPYRSIEYLIYDIDKKSKKGSLVYTLNSAEGFIQDILLDLPENNHSYIVRTILTDSSKNSSKYVDSEIELPKIILSR